MQKPTNQDEIVIILDFGGQYTHLIARRVRELNVYSEILPFNSPISELKKYNIKGIILSGGPSSVYEKDAPTLQSEFFKFCEENNIPVLGICYGLQLIAHILNGKVEPRETKEYGKTNLFIDNKEDLFKTLDDSEIVWMSHGDQVTKLADGFQVIAHTGNCPVAAFKKDKIYGIQFHIEVSHTEKGIQILRNFLYNICNCTKSWKLGDWIEDTIQEIRNQVGEDQVVMALSGGVDSSIAAALIHRAIGDRLHCIFIDNGLLRKNEPEQVVNTFERVLGFKNFHFIDVSNIFLDRLRGVIDPEEKRKIIAYTFFEIFEKKALELSKSFGEISFLGQGTIYPDRVETAVVSQQASKIKSHHNVTLPEKMKLKLVEPLRDLYKDEVRIVGEKIGLPEEIIWRHPFPGPGLAIRIIGDVTQEKIDILQHADAIVTEEIKNSGLYKKLWQAFAVLLDTVRSVGVMGDFRTYEYTVAIRAVTSEDAMTADWAKLPPELLERISNRISNEVREVNRVVYDISQKPPSTIEFL